MSEKTVRKKRKISKEEAQAALWEMGELTWTLSDIQKEMKRNIFNDTSRTSVVVCSRRLGKTWMMVTLALEQCLSKPNSIVKFLLPKQKDAKTVIKPLMREILETHNCPDEFRPKYNSQDKIFEFEHNGSEIHLGGSDLSAESLRGTRADLVLIDEAGFVSDLLYCIRSILSPTIRTTRGRMVLASTPSRSPDHEFIQYFMNPYKASGRLKVYDIYKNPNFTPEIIQEIIDEYPSGVNDPDFRREYMCEVFADSETTIAIEYSQNKAVIDIDDYEVPDHVDFYTSMDVGFKDLTVILFSYYDFNEACLYIVDEFVVNGVDTRTDNLSLEIRKAEELRYIERGNQKAPYLRVSDTDLKLINDLNQIHDLIFIPTAKDKKHAAINKMKMWLNQGRVKIHERCKTLKYHLEFGQWNKKRSDFARLADTPDGELRGGHVDAIPALYYLIRNVQEMANPYPAGYGKAITKNTFISAKYKTNEVSKAAAIMKRIMNITSKK